MATAFSSAPEVPLPASGDPTAVFGRRVVAALIDVAIVGVPGVAISSTALMSYDLTGSDLDGEEFCDRYLEQHDAAACLHVDDTAYFTDDEFDPATLAPLGLAVLLFVVIQGITGWTIGKLLMGLRTVKEDGSKVGLGRALVRWLMWIVDGLPCLAIVGLITAGTSTGHRRVGDIVAKTYVVGKAHAGSPIQVPGAVPTFTSAPPAQPVAGPWGQPAAPPMAHEPQWDAARGTYIQWDAAQSKWLQWDDSSRSWIPIPGQ